MKTSDIFKRSSAKINESIEQIFGKKINLESFTLDQLQDARNKLRTQISQVRSESAFNETLENEAFTQAQWMLDAINAEIAEREEFIVDPIEEYQAEGADQETKAAHDAGYKDASQGKKKNPYNPGSPSAKNYDDGQDSYKRHFGEEAVSEKAPPTAKGERMVKHIKKGYAKDGKLTDKEKSIAYATAWKHHNKNESVNTGDNMTKLKEGEIQQASAIVNAKTMVDRVGRWIEELSGMENDTLLQLGDSIRDEMGSEQAKSFISAVAPAIQQALENLKATRETLATGVRQLTGEEQGAEMLGAEPGAEGGDEFGGAAEPDMMNAGGDEGGDIAPAEPTDDFGASDAAAGGLEAAGREKRESIERGNSLLRVLAG